jgi:choline dehydrogenase-like flavoprotein
MDYRNRTGSTRKNIEAHMVDGSDPKKSVLNQFQQAHDVKNLFVMDASSFTSKPCQNPKLTIMALCVRSCDYLMDELKRSEL